MRKMTLFQAIRAFIRLGSLSTLCLLLFPLSLLASQPVEKPFVILITSYNNQRFCAKNIRSALKQDYSNFRVIFINDCSDDDTFAIVERTVKEMNPRFPVTLIDNPVRRKALANIYDAIHEHIHDGEIVVSLDGDDLLAGPYVLSYLNQIYSNPKKEVWLTYGQFTQLCSGHNGWCVEMPEEVVKENRFRSFTHIPSHLRTFYAGLFKKIAKEDLLYQGEFFPMTWDMAMMLPMLEMARNGHFAFIPKVLYIYNDGNQLSDHVIDSSLQKELDLHIRDLPPYEALESL